MGTNIKECAGAAEPRPYFNRELSWLAFNKRVLNLCENPNFPILEKLRFLSIASTNLDEFFEIRVAGLKQQIESGVAGADFDGIGARELLRRIRVMALAMNSEKYRIFQERILPELRENKIFIKRPANCSAKEKAFLEKYFFEKIHPALTPMSVDPAHPFPFLYNKGTYVMLTIADASQKRAKGEVAIVLVPPILTRVIRLENGKSGEWHIVLLSDVIKYFAERLFPGYKARNKALIRITRNSDLYIDEEETENLLKTIEDELHRQKKGAAVRLEAESEIAETNLRLLMKSLDLGADDVYKIDSYPFSMQRMLNVYDFIDRPDLKFAPFKPAIPPPLKTPAEIFDVLKERDILLHHPYESFEPVEKFIASAATDESVLAVKLTLYRTNSNSKILNSLKEAASKGKQVTVLVELKARGDEEKNIRWARELEEMGAHVVYGIVGLKTHCKTCLVVRNEPVGLRLYAHIGTGNYNSNTAKAYTDLSYMTSKPEICEDVAKIFNTLTGKVARPQFKKLIVAPFYFHDKFDELVRREIKNARAGKPARIIAKTNALIEQSAIDLLYEASQAGVKIDLVVRGICGLVPGVKGVSENITVRSIVGVYLEHSRIYYFLNGGEPEVFAGSGDLMPRNMYRRIECIFPIEDAEIKSRVINDILPAYLGDNLYADLLHPNGAYFKSAEMKAAEPFSAQEYFMKSARGT
ncbi:MAG: polyphosphate kinase 1 [Opitutales bacterium]|nr:polyphosphate kinase 1 [Opitutales bacterium]